MKLTNEGLNEIKGYNLSDDSFFSEGTVITLDGSAYELVEICGDQLFFEPSDDLKTAKENDKFYFERAE